MSHAIPSSIAHGRSLCARDNVRIISLLAVLLASVACGVQEHPHSLDDQAMGGVGGKFAPPPPVTSGGAVLNGGTTNVAGATFAGSGGASGSGTLGGATNAGAPAATGGSLGNGGNASGGTTTMSGGATVATSGGVSGITIDINGTMLPKEDVIAFIHIGHSNMAGRTNMPAAQQAYFFKDVDLRSWMYSSGNWSPALEPTAGDSGNYVNGQTLGGPGTALLKQAVTLAPSKYFVSLGFGRASAYCSQFLPGGLYYDSLIANPKALKGKITFGAIVIMLGITERHGTAQDISNYPNCINSLVTSIRTDVGEPNLPLLITDYEMEATNTATDQLAPTSTFGMEMIPQIHMIPSVVSNSALVPTDGLGMQDDHHFNLDGHKEWTRRALQIMKDKGWFPWQ